MTQVRLSIELEVSQETVSAYENQRQLAIYHGKLYRTPWTDKKDLTFHINGRTMDEILSGFIEQIALREEQAQPIDERSIDERLRLQDKILKLEQQIAKTEAAAWREQQPKKRFALYQKLRNLKKIR